MVAYSELAAIRLGYGLSPLTPSPANPAEVLASVALAGPDADAVGMARVRKLQRRSSEFGRQLKTGDARARQEYDKIQRRAADLSRLATQRRIARAVADPAGFGERLVQFWADHFTVSGGNAFLRLMAAAFVDEAIRPHLGGRFEDMMFAVETHPRMLVYLNQDRSIGPNSEMAKRAKAKGQKLGLNENLAREMIELHSLGVGASYTQKDVRQLAELLTGLIYLPREQDVFRAVRAEPGAETVLGKSYGGKGPAKLDDIRAVIRDLARHPDTARHLARKLAVHFVADDPPQALIDRLAGVYLDSKGDLSAVNGALVEAPELDSHFRQKMRQPFEFMVASLRGLGLDGAGVMALEPKTSHNWLVAPLAAMGQDWGKPRGPDGWPEAAVDWATPQGLAARMDWAMRVPGRLRPELPDPRVLLDNALGQTASEALKWAVPKAESTREGVLIVLASADFNRR